MIRRCAAECGVSIWVMRASSLVLVGLFAAVVVFESRPEAQPATPGAAAGYDVLITNGRIVDGTGAPWYRGDVAISGDRIAAIGTLTGATARQKVDATNFVVSPGFIDLLGQSEFNVLVDGRAASKVLQGVTTEVTGEGSSIAPVNDRMIKDAQPQYQHFGVGQDFRTLGEYFKRLAERSRTTINVATFVGAGGIRNYVIGKDDSPATKAGRGEH